MNNWRNDRIVVVTSHKFDNIWPYTRIVNLKDGRIVSEQSKEKVEIGNRFDI